MKPLFFGKLSNVYFPDSSAVVIRAKVRDSQRPKTKNRKVEKYEPNRKRKNRVGS